MVLPLRFRISFIVDFWDCPTKNVHVHLSLFVLNTILVVYIEAIFAHEVDPFGVNNVQVAVMVNFMKFAVNRNATQSSGARHV